MNAIFLYKQELNKKKQSGDLKFLDLLGLICNKIIGRVLILDINPWSHLIVFLHLPRPSPRQILITTVSNNLLIMATTLFNKPINQVNQLMKVTCQCIIIVRISPALQHVSFWFFIDAYFISCINILSTATFYFENYNLLMM